MDTFCISNSTAICVQNVSKICPNIIQNKDTFWTPFGHILDMSKQCPKYVHKVSKYLHTFWICRNSQFPGNRHQIAPELPGIVSMYWMGLKTDIIMVMRKRKIIIFAHLCHRVNDRVSRRQWGGHLLLAAIAAQVKGPCLVDFLEDWVTQKWGFHRNHEFWLTSISWNLVT